MDVLRWDLPVASILYLLNLCASPYTSSTNASQLKFTCCLGTDNLSLLLLCLSLVFDFHQQLPQACCSLTCPDVSEIACQES